VLITASSDGRFGHQAVAGDPAVIEAKDVDQLQLADTIHQDKGRWFRSIIDETTRKEVKQLMDNFIRCLN